MANDKDLLTVLEVHLKDLPGMIRESNRAVLTARDLVVCRRDERGELVALDGREFEAHLVEVGNNAAQIVWANSDEAQ